MSNEEDIVSRSAAAMHFSSKNLQLAASQIYRTLQKKKTGNCPIHTALNFDKLIHFNSY